MAESKTRIDEEFWNLNFIFVLREPTNMRREFGFPNFIDKGYVHVNKYLILLNTKLWSDVNRINLIFEI